MTTDTFPTQETINVIEFFTVLLSGELARYFVAALPLLCTFAEVAQLPQCGQLCKRITNIPVILRAAVFLGSSRRKIYL